MIEGKRIIAIPPAYNEEGKIGRVVSKIPRNIVDEILVVCDGCTDNTQIEAENAGAKIISHRERKGVGAAIRSGIEFAIKQKYDIIAILAGNDKDDPSQIRDLVCPIIRKGFNYVQGSRYLPSGECGKLPFHRRVGTRLYPILVYVFTGYKMTDVTNGFRAFETKIFDDKRINIWQEWLDGYELEYYLLLKVIKLGYKIKEVPVRKIYPQTSKYHEYTKARPLIDWMRALRPLIYLAFGLRD